MVSKEDWAAAMDSEIFREYLRTEISQKSFREAAEKQALAEAEEAQINEELKTYEELSELEKKIKSSPELLATFKEARNKILANPEVLKNADPSFVNGILMLNLEDQNDA